jgi:hypothetical protein
VVSEGETKAADAEIGPRYEDLPKEPTFWQKQRIDWRRGRQMNCEIRRDYFRSLHLPWNMPKWDGTDR